MKFSRLLYIALAGSSLIGSPFNVYACLSKVMLDEYEVQSNTPKNNERENDKKIKNQKTGVLVATQQTPQKNWPIGTRSFNFFSEETM